MSEATLNILEAALGLPDEEKADLVDLLLQNIHRPGASVEQAWEAEITRRVDAIEAGNSTLHDAEDVFAELRRLAK